MRPLPRPVSVALAAVAAVAGLLTATPALPAAAAQAATPSPTATATSTDTSPATHAVAACAPAARGLARCGAQYVAAAGQSSALAVQPGAAPDAAGQLKPLTPAQLQAAYDVDTTRGTGRTIAIVDAYDDPKAEKDLKVFRATYGLPACTTANGCFRKVNQDGQAAPLPPGDQGWGVEIALDLQAASAICPRCNLLLVEGDDSSLKALGIAENTAVALGATVVSNSYGADEFAGAKGFGRRYYVHPGVPVLASSGDFGFGPASFPAVLPTTLAVGGTTITKSSTDPRGWTETAWSGAGSGCSAYVRKPSWQQDTHCLYRTVADVSAAADPDTGLVIYDTYGTPGWIQVGGTSLSSPLVAAMVAMSADPTAYDDASAFYTDPSLVHDVVGGSNGTCGKDYLCTAVPGYDGPTGVGSPIAGLL